MEYYDGFIPIAAIFYAVFHPTEGTKIVHQVPQGSISSTSTSKDPDQVPVGNREALFHFDTVRNFIIPKPQLCNKLISFKINKFRVIGYPVNIENSYYARNSFNFNFCFVFPYDVGDVSPYQPAIRRIGNMFKVLEEQNFMLSKLDKSNSFYKALEAKNHPMIRRNFLSNTPGYSRTGVINLSSIESLISQIYQDLNNYSECCIPIDSANSVDIKLFPILPPPTNVRAFDVPIPTVKLTTLTDINSDPTMIKILPFINGLNSIKKISDLANATYFLTKQCIQHLMHYKCIQIIDIFQFSNIYAPTNHIGKFLLYENHLAEECQAYIIANNDYSIHPQTPMSVNSNGSEGIVNSFSPSTSKSGYFSKSKSSSLNLSQINKVNITIPSKTTLFYLYRSLNQGQTVKEWYIQNQKLLENIDIRRFINFGILRRIIYRVHSYPILNSIVRSIENNEYFEIEMPTKLKVQMNQDLEDQSENTRKVSFMNKSETTVLDESDQEDSESLNSSDEDGDVNEDGVDADQDEGKDEMVTTKGNTANKKNEADNEASNRSSLKLAKISKSSTISSHIDEEEEEMKILFKLLKGFQNYDSLCTELRKSRQEIDAMISKLGSHNLVNS